MKRNISILTMVVLFTTGIVACTNSNTKNENPVVETDTSYLHPIILADSSGLHHIMETGEVYTCVMHHGVISDKPGACPTCGMTLIKQKLTDAQKKMLKEGTFIKPKY